MLSPNQKPSSSYSLLKFIYVTSQLRHSFVVHPLLRKILDPPRLIGVRGWVWGYNRCRGVGLGCGVWGVGCGAIIGVRGWVWGVGLSATIIARLAIK